MNGWVDKAKKKYLECYATIIKNIFFHFADEDIKAG